MSDNRKKIIAGLAAAGGGAAAFFGVRGLIRWLQRRSADVEYQRRTRKRMRGTPVEGTRFQPQDQPDRQPIPATGPEAMVMEAPARRAEDLARDVVEGDRMAAANQSADAVGDLTGPLLEYLLAFHGMIGTLRDRRQVLNSPSERSLTPDDRARYQDTLDRLDDQLPDYAEGNIADGSLQERVYRLTSKVRGALRDYDYSDDDLFRIYGEVRSEACRLLDEIRGSGQGGQENFDHVFEAYRC